MKCLLVYYAIIIIFKHGLGILGFLSRDSWRWVSLPRAHLSQCWVKERVIGKMEKGFGWNLNQWLSSTAPQEQ